MQDGAGCHHEKSLHLRNRLTDFDETWHGDASPPAGSHQQINFENY